MAIIAHIDMDCFFAACEEKRYPSLRGRSVVIGGKEKRGVVCTANYLARKFGVHSAMPAHKAHHLCPHAIFLDPDHTYYKTESQKIMSLLQSFVTVYEQASIDEIYLDITQLVDQHGTLLDTARFLRQQVFEKTGYTCSIGVAYSRRVAKIASDFKKPHGITVVYNTKNFLAPLSIKKIPGIGKKSSIRYQHRGIQTIGDLAKLDIFTQLDWFGKSSYSYWKLARGEDNSYISDDRVEKSISNETTFSDDIIDKQTLFETIHSLCERIYKRLKSFVFKTVSIKLRDQHFHTITRSLSLQFCTQKLDDLVSVAYSLFEKNWDFQTPIRLVGVKVDHLIESQFSQKTLLDF